jgi:predicted component of type VI protein secretion system
MPTRTSKASKVQSQSKTSFVLALPADLSVGEVVKKAKAAGIALSPNYVSNIRSSAKTAAKQQTAKPKAAVKAARATRVAPLAFAKPVATPAAAAPPLTVTEFIKSQPRDIPAADVVKAAKRTGLKIDANYVYKVRSRLGAKPAPQAIAAAPRVAAKVPAPKATQPAPTPKASKAPPAPKAAPPLPAAQKSSGASSDVAFKKLVVELGVARAETLLVEVKKKLAELFAGG